MSVIHRAAEPAEKRLRCIFMQSDAIIPHCPKFSAQLLPSTIIQHFFTKRNRSNKHFFKFYGFIWTNFLFFKKNARPNNADPQQKTAFAGIFTEIPRKSPKIPCAKAAIPSGNSKRQNKRQNKRAKTRYRSYFVFFLFFPRENLDLKKSLSVSRFLYRNTNAAASSAISTHQIRIPHHTSNGIKFTE